jgi:hypothetical protein
LDRDGVLGSSGPAAARALVLPDRVAPLFIWFAPDMTRRELTDFVGQKIG